MVSPPAQLQLRLNRTNGKISQPVGEGNKMARRRKQKRKWGRWIAAALLIGAVAAAVVIRSPKYKQKFWAQVSLLADRLDQLATAIKKPAVPDEPPPKFRPQPPPSAPSAPPMEKPIPEADKKKLEKILEPKSSP